MRHELLRQGQDRHADGHLGWAHVVLLGHRDVRRRRCAFFEIARSRSARPRPLRSYPLLLFATGISMVFDKARRRPTDIVVRARVCSKRAAARAARDDGERSPGAMVGEARDAFERLRDQLVGAENLPSDGNGYMVVPNHCSCVRRDRAWRARVLSLSARRLSVYAPPRAQLPRHLHALRVYASTAQVRVED